MSLIGFCLDIRHGIYCFLHCSLLLDATHTSCSALTVYLGAVPPIIIYIIFLSVFMSVDFDWLKRKLLSVCFSHCGIIRSVTLLHTAYLCFVWWLNTKYRDLFVNWSFCLLFLFQQILFKSNQDLHQLVFVGLRDTTILGFIISSFIFWAKNLCKWRLL